MLWYRTGMDLYCQSSELCRMNAAKYPVTNYGNTNHKGEAWQRYPFVYRLLNVVLVVFAWHLLRYSNDKFYMKNWSNGHNRTEHSYHYFLSKTLVALEFFKWAGLYSMHCTCTCTSETMSDTNQETHFFTNHKHISWYADKIFVQCCLVSQM